MQTLKEYHLLGFKVGQKLSLTLSAPGLSLELPGIPVAVK
jgi:hypothetical protein